jgi:hypothetical protein
LCFDIAPYFIYLSDDAKKEVIAHFETLYATRVEPARKCRAQLNLEKLTHALELINKPGYLTHKEQIMKLQKFYLQFISLDGKPAKGERKIADDFVILIHEILEKCDY